jgi:N-methylhydantoinase B/oxoprolinase/acetone carboxylase alpha subunit
MEKTTVRRRRVGVLNGDGRPSSATRRSRGSRQPTEQVLADLDRMISALIKENGELHRQIDRLSRQASSGTSGTAERALRSLQVRISRAVDGGTTSRRRQPARAATVSTTRRRVTDPEVLERRRQALVKARQALAAKRAGGS